MNRDELALIWFTYEGYSFSSAEKILKKFDNLSDIFDKNKAKNALFDLNNKLILEKLFEINEDDFRKRVEDDLYKSETEVMTYVSEDYPEKLKSIDEPPLALFYKGNKKLFSEKSISIVGTRKPTTYGRIVCEKFTNELSTAGLVTVSGLAYGIDTVVAEKTLLSGGKTIAVLAGGLDSIYPSQNTGLAEKIVKSGGLLVSEYPCGRKPQSFHFINRNRIVSALGDGLLIIEAGKSSGTMSTAKFAIDQSRELFVIPGNITSTQSEGTNNLIDEMPDTFTISPARILYKLGVKKKESPKSDIQIDMTENKILEVLSDCEMSFDNLCDKTGISPSVLSAKLIKMEMFGMVKKGNGNIYYKM